MRIFFFFKLEVEQTVKCVKCTNIKCETHGWMSTSHHEVNVFSSPECACAPSGQCAFTGERIF